MEAWHIWLTVGLLLMAAEIVTSGFLVLLFGVACLAAAGADLLGLGLKLQVLVFCAATLVSFAAIRPALLRWTAGSDVPSNTDALIGQVGQVVAVATADSQARVKIGGEDWRSRTADGRPLPLGATVTVAQVDGATLIVIPKES